MFDSKLGDTKEMASTPEFRKEFVKRLTQACDESPAIPEPYFGRQTVIAQQLGVANESVNKWFQGVSMPRPEKMKALAKLLGVDQAWLSMGVNPEMDRKERRVHAKAADGATSLVFGLMSMAGISCGTPAPTDPRAEYTDFYAMIRGSVYPIRVCLAREVEENKYEVIIPREFRDLRVICVVSLGADRFHFLDMNAQAIEEVKSASSGNYTVTIDRDSSGSKYSSEKVQWPRIRTFSEML